MCSILDTDSPRTMRMLVCVFIVIVLNVYFIFICGFSKDRRILPPDDFVPDTVIRDNVVNICFRALCAQQCVLFWRAIKLVNFEKCEVRIRTIYTGKNQNYRSFWKELWRNCFVAILSVQRVFVVQLQRCWARVMLNLDVLFVQLGV